ncbi:DUF4326 domain-containing protein [Rhodococcus sp. IEGM 1409]|uniref:DUF4326 domain-containing protein n=1 Tax=Rhodococcus sp. IEGM 1409 TaxID=3047082 RepID=UPI0024B85130|nr:DUF4326 domain-containing protein [Rhodococcus sp. IEGM 1409]MDI9901324.1 DUF4326 domain-containing protein [Rhodococcus sp. IEGM 1409]
MNAPKRVECESLPTPAGTVYVSQDSKWECPITFSDVGAQYPSLDMAQVGNLINQDFRVLARKGRLSFPNWRYLGGRRGPVTWTYPSLAEIRAELAGKDLACWCPIDEPCHADVLLEIANGSVQ